MITNKKRARIISIIILFGVILTTVLLIVSAQVSPYLYLFLAMVVIILTSVVKWHASVTLYKCENCSEEFKISSIVDFVSIHTPEKKLLKCPHCHTTDLMKSAS